MTPDPVLIGLLIVLFVAFMFVPKLTAILGRNLDTLPIRLAAAILVLVAVGHDKLVGLGTFLVVTAVYIQHHQNDLTGLTNSSMAALDPYAMPKAPINLEHGGHADESYETADYTPQKEDQDNEFAPVGHSQDEKQVLVSETLGSRGQAMFNDDMKHAEAMAMSNRNGSD
jgi:hypothetical protein